MTRQVRRSVRRVVGFAAALVLVGGAGWAQRSTAAATSVVMAASLPAGDGAAALRSAFAALLDVGAADQATVAFVDHAAVRAGGAPVFAWYGLQVAVGVVDLIRPADAASVEQATGLSLAEVATTLVVDVSVPAFLTLVRGPFDPDRVDAALASRGYEPVADDHARRWCGARGCDGGFTVDLASRDPDFALFGGVLGRSFPALLAGDLLAVGPVPEALDATLATVAGQAPSVLERPEVAALVDALDVDAVVRQVWMPFGAYVLRVAPPGARSILFADARRGGDEWLLVAAAFEDAAAAGAFAAGALEALGLTGGADPAPGSLAAALRALASDARIDRVTRHGLEVVRVVVARPFPDGVGTLQDRPAALLHVMMTGIMRFEVPWVAR